MSARLSLSALFTASVLFVVGAAPAHAAGAPTTTELGLELVPWSKKLGERRYESPRDYDGTVKFFRDQFKGWKQIRWTREVSLPAVKYIHLENTGGTSKWEGVNIYVLPDGRVRYFVLERKVDKKEQKAAVAAPSSAAPTAPAAAQAR